MKKAELKIKTMKINDLKKQKAKYNPRNINTEQKNGLRHSIDKFGYVQNIIYNEKTKTVISGHQRIDILLEKGYDSVDVHVVNLNKDDEKKLNIAMNSGTITGDFSLELFNILDKFVEDDPEFYDMLNLSGLLNDLSEEDNEEPEQNKEENKEIVEGMKLLPYESYDCILVVCKRRDDFMFLSSMLDLNKKRIISAPMVKNKKTGYTRCVDAKDLINKINEKQNLIDKEDMLGLDDDDL